MAGFGPPPKETRSRVRDAKSRAGEFTHLEPDGQVRGYALPEDVLPDGADWHPQTRQWWETWRHSAQAQQMLDTDWDALLDTALMHHVMWTKGKWEFASEIRLRAAKYGATVEDRLRLRMTVHTTSGEALAVSDGGDDASVTSIRSRRSRLTG